MDLIIIKSKNVGVFTSTYTYILENTHSKSKITKANSPIYVYQPIKSGKQTDTRYVSKV